MRNNGLNLALFTVLSGAMIAFYLYSEKNRKLNPPEPPPAAEAKTDPAVAVAAAAGPAAALRPGDFPKPASPPPPAAPVEPPTLVALGDDGFYNKLLLSTRGGGVQQVVLPKYHEANRLGLEARRLDDTPYPLFLVPGTVRPRTARLADEAPYPDLAPGKTAPGANLAEPSYTVFHYPTPDDKYPLPDLGERNWKLAAQSPPGELPQSVAFETDLGEPYFMRIRKTYTLAPKDYHAGLKVAFERLPGGAKGKGQLRYQLSGPRGLPIEGEWYTSTYRNALIGRASKRGTAVRTLEDPATVAVRRGSDPVERGEYAFKYAAVATQYFASAMAVDDSVPGFDPWTRVRATTELPLAPSPDEVKRAEEEARADPADPVKAGRAARLRALVEPSKFPQFDDLTVRAVSDPLDLAPGEKVEHSYLLYNGPAKVRLLKLLTGDRAVDQGLVDRYLDGLGLKTITDYQSPTAIGNFANSIYWTDLVLVFTNLMHWLLAGIHWVLAGLGLGDISWGLSIVVLTVMVRLTLFLPSRKSTQMNMRMVELQKRLKPDIDKLHEKYKDDFQAFNREKTALMLKNGMNPLAAMGGCVLIFAQMPIMMGLYFGLQESVFFRLEPFLWAQNLAAPDMLAWWGEGIPMISAPDALGGFVYLGPYLNLFPLLAVGLMLYQQNKMMPPPTDEAQASQQRMMKIMMLVMALFFYKVAAGLALYFIISTGWGILERQFVPKPKEPTEGPGGGPDGGSGPSDPTPKPQGRVGRWKAQMRDKLEELQQRAEEQSSRQLKNSRDPNRPKPDPFRRDTGDRKKKRRK